MKNIMFIIVIYFIHFNMIMSDTKSNTMPEFEQFDSEHQSSNVGIDNTMAELDLNAETNSKKKKHMSKKAKEKQTKSKAESKSVFDSESDSESELDSETKKKTITKTPKALKTEKRNKELKNKSKKKSDNDDESDNDDFNKFQIHTSVFDNFKSSNDAFGFVETPDINIRVIQRNARKTITIIEDLPSKLFENDELLDTMLTELRTKISARACVKTTDDGKYIIETSGNRVKIMSEVICKYTKCDISSIKIHGVHC